MEAQTSNNPAEELARLKKDAEGKTKRTKFTMAEWGPKLPIGTVDPTSGELRKDMSHRVWNLKLERVLGKLRDKKQNANMARFASVVVHQLYTQLGAHTVDPTNRQSLVQIGQMFMGDVLYAYMWLRKEFIGPTLEMELTCPRCGHTPDVPFKADLDSLEVNVVHKLEDTYWTHPLRHALEVRKTEVRTINMGLPRWLSMEKGIGGPRDTSGPKAALILSALRPLEDLDGSPLAERDLDELSKWDLEQLSGGIDAHHLGPDLAAESECLSCGKEFRVSVDWVYDNFFAVSGRSASGGQ